jgi:hypothetical protein
MTSQLTQKPRVQPFRLILLSQLPALTPAAQLLMDLLWTGTKTQPHKAGEQAAAQLLHSIGTSSE